MPYAKELEDGVVELAPQPGPQTDFLSTPADIAFFGGEAGGGKSGGLLLAASAFVHVPGYAAVIFRRDSTQLTGGGSLWEDSQEIYPYLGGIPTSSPIHRWTFSIPESRPALIEMRHLQHEKDKQAHQGKQYAFIGFDEVTHFTEGQFWYLVSRARSTCGVRPMIRCTCNPDPDSFVRQLIDWWIGPDGLAIQSRSGVIRWLARVSGRIEWVDSKEELVARFGPKVLALSVTFIRSRLEDNPALKEADPDYEAKLEALSLVDRARLRGGDWNIRATAGNVFRRSWFEILDAAPTDIVRVVRAWDLAGTEPSDENPDPDWTRGVKVGITKVRADGRRRYVILDLVSARVMGGAIESLIKATAAQDGKGVTQAFWTDPAQAGGFQADYFKRMLRAFHVETITATKNKLAYAKLWSPHAEPKKDDVYGLVQIIRAPWTDEVLAEAQGFSGEPDAKGHDDIIDACSRAFVELEKPRAPKAKAVRIHGV